MLFTMYASNFLQLLTYVSLQRCNRVVSVLGCQCQVNCTLTFFNNNIDDNQYLYFCFNISMVCNMLSREESLF